MFYSSDMTPTDHQGRVFNTELKIALGIPREVNNMHEHTLLLGADYSRLKMLTIVSAWNSSNYWNSWKSLRVGMIEKLPS